MGQAREGEATTDDNLVEEEALVGVKLASVVVVVRLAPLDAARLARWRGGDVDEAVAPVAR